MIRKKERLHSETGTTIDQGVEVTQKGIIALAIGVGKVFSIPCTIPKPELVTITPLTELSGIGLSQFSTDFVLHYASGAKGFASYASLSNLSEVGYRTRMHPTTYQLYTAVASMSGANLASNSLLASKSLWRPEEAYVGNLRPMYLNLTVGNTGSASFKAKRQLFSYEIKGYES